jgi:hypothetical protein
MPKVRSMLQQTSTNTTRPTCTLRTATHVSGVKTAASEYLKIEPRSRLLRTRGRMLDAVDCHFLSCSIPRLL